MTEKLDEISEDLLWIIGYMVWGSVFLNDECLAGGAAPVEAVEGSEKFTGAMKSQHTDKIRSICTAFEKKAYNYQH